MVKFVAIAIAIALCSGACSRASQDRQIVGSWYYAYVIDAAPGITFDPDHTFTVWNEDDGRREDMVFGTWRVEGD